MADHAIELQNVNKQFTSRREATVAAVENISLTVEDGEFFSLLGPSGCGKTTTLRMIAGFEEPTSGRVLIEGQDMVGIPPFHRPVNTVFQDYALFPHMTVEQNIAFGLEMQGKPRSVIKERVREMLDLVQLPGLERRYPKQLSGGQQQRVALARSLVKEPKVLLLDEPLGALDLKLRKQMQLELKQMQRQLGITFIYVTHDQEEALMMSDRIAVMNKGKVLQVGPAGEIYDRPANHFVADFIGETNFLDGAVTEINPESDEATVMIADQYPFRGQLRHAHTKLNDKVQIAIRPEKVELCHVGETEPNANCLPGRVKERIYIGTDTRYIIGLSDGSSVVSRIQNDGNHDKSAFPVGTEVNLCCLPEYSLILLD